MSKLLFWGALSGVLGAVALIAPTFQTHQTTQLSSIGNFTIPTEPDTSHTIPPLVAGGFVVLGMILFGSGLYKSIK